MTWRDYTVNDPSSTANPSLGGPIKQAIQYPRKATGQQRKQSSALHAVQQDLTRRAVSDLIETHASATRVDPREYDDRAAALMAARRHAHEQHGNVDAYSFFAHPETRDGLMRLFDAHAGVKASMRGVDEMRLFGHDVVAGRDIPTGWVVFADGDKLDDNPIVPHPLALVADVFTKFPTVSLSVGGQMEFTVTDNE